MGPIASQPILHEGHTLSNSPLTQRRVWLHRVSRRLDNHQRILPAMIIRIGLDQCRVVGHTFIQVSLCHNI
jgi:hypothetical protein